MTFRAALTLIGLLVLSTAHADPPAPSNHESASRVAADQLHGTRRERITAVANPDSEDAWLRKIFEAELPRVREKVSTFGNGPLVDRIRAMGEVIELVHKQQLVAAGNGEASWLRFSYSWMIFMSTKGKTIDDLAAWLHVPPASLALFKKVAEARDLRGDTLQKRLKALGGSIPADNEDAQALAWAYQQRRGTVEKQKLDAMAGMSIVKDPNYHFRVLSKLREFKVAAPGGDPKLEVKDAAREAMEFLSATKASERAGVADKIATWIKGIGTQWAHDPGIRRLYFAARLAQKGGKLADVIAEQRNIPSGSTDRLWPSEAYFHEHPDDAAFVAELEAAYTANQARVDAYHRHVDAIKRNQPGAADAFRRSGFNNDVTLHFLASQGADGRAPLIALGTPGPGNTLTYNIRRNPLEIGATNTNFSGAAVGNNELIAVSIASDEAAFNAFVDRMKATPAFSFNGPREGENPARRYKTAANGSFELDNGASTPPPRPAPPGGVTETLPDGPPYRAAREAANGYQTPKPPVVRGQTAAIAGIKDGQVLISIVVVTRAGPLPAQIRARISSPREAARELERIHAALRNGSEIQGSLMGNSPQDVILKVVNGAFVVALRGGS